MACLAPAAIVLPIFIGIDEGKGRNVEPGGFFNATHESARIDARGRCRLKLKVQFALSKKVIIPTVQKNALPLRDLLGARIIGSGQRFAEINGVGGLVKLLEGHAKSGGIVAMGRVGREIGEAYTRKNIYVARRSKGPRRCLLRGGFAFEEVAVASEGRNHPAKPP
ncbi:hypothetical protein WN48_11051 [Eufriesea mexicana]|nr:hypothetical protein WN48_11051 [Eufriesea mexicana]